MLSKCNFSISGFLLVLGLHESRPNMENIFQLPVSPDRAAVILSSGRGDWADLQTHPVPALWCQMVQISRLILSIINSIFNLFSVSEYSISKLTNGIRGRCGTKSLDSERRDREEPFASQRGEREPEGEGDTRDVTRGQTPGTGALVTSHQQWPVVSSSQRAQGSGQWTPVRHMSCQGPVLVNGDTSGVRGALNGQGMVSTCHHTPGIGQSALCTGQCAAPIGRKISQICGNSREIVTKPRARPCLATLGGRSGDGVSWFVLIWGSSLIVLFLASQLHQYQIS